jgi:hypothetical protein
LPAYDSTHTQGIVVSVNFSVSPEKAGVGEAVTVTDIGRNLTSVSWGDGYVWLFEESDNPPYVAVHTYKSAGTYTIEGIDIRILPDGSKEIGSSKKQVVISEDPTPTPEPVVGVWASLVAWIKKVIAAIFGVSWK